MAHPRHWDARLHALIGGLPTTPADRWLRRLSTAANHGPLWLGLAALTGVCNGAPRRGGRKGPPRRGAVRGIGSMWVSSALLTLVLKRFFGRVRPDMANLNSDRR